MAKLRMILTALCVAGAAFGETGAWTDPSGITWAIECDKSDYTASIGNGLAHAITFATKGAVAIPEEVFYNGDAYKVTAIAAKALQTCSKIESVSIPETVTSIGNQAFDGCSALVEVNFLGRVKNITVDFAAAFGGTPYAASINANDNFANAEDLGSAEEGTINDVNILATVEAGEPLPAENSSQKYTKWYKWTAPEGVTSAIFHTYGSNFDTVLGVYTGAAVDALTKVVMNDDGGDDGTSKAWFAVTPGVTYHICVAGYDELGTISLSWRASSEFELIVADDGTLLGFVGECPEEVEIPGYVERIGMKAFSHKVFPTAVAGLKRVVIHAGIKSIGAAAFIECPNLADVEFEGDAIDIDIGKDAFFNTAFINSGASNANNNFANAKDLGDDVSGTVTDVNGSATIETGEPLPAKNAKYKRTKWYKWKAPAGVTSALFSTFGSTFDTVMGVYTGTAVNALTEVAFNDDGYVRESRVKFDVTPGTSYYICVGGYNDNCGLISLNWFAADGFALAVSDSGTLYGITGTCPESIEIADDVLRIADYAFYNDTYKEPTAGNLKSLKISGSVERIGDHAFNSCGNLADVAFAGPMQDVEIGTGAFTYTPYRLAGMANDNFSGAIDLLSAASGSHRDCSYEATEENGEPLPRKSIYYHRTKWYEWTAPADTFAWFDTFGSDFDTVMGIYDGTSLGTISTVCFNDDCSGPCSGAAFRAEAGKTYYICVGGWDGGYGQIALNWKTSDSFELIIDESGTLCGFIGECPAELTLPSTVRSIGSNAFSSESVLSKNLSIITIPGSVKKIGSEAFDGCEYLCTVNLSEGLEDLFSAGIFSRCSALHYIHIPYSVKDLHEGAFYNMGCHVDVHLPAKFKTEVATGSYGTTDLTATYYAKLKFDGKGSTYDFTPYNECFDCGTYLYVPEPDRRGYTFNGWDPYFYGTVPDEDTTYNAKWTPNEYSFYFYANEGEFYEDGGVNFLDMTLAYGSPVVAPKVRREGYTFAGWDPAEVPATMTDEYLSFYAQWTPNKHKVTFDANGGTGGTVLTLEYDTYLWDYVPETTREGYTFLGWEPEIDLSCPDHDVTYKAKWQINECWVSFYANGGTFTENDDSYWQKWMNYGETLTAPAVKWEGHIFKGWSPKVPATVPDEGSLDFEAQWETIQYSVTVNLCGGTGTGGKIKVDHGTCVYDLPYPEREGYSFDWWYTAPEGGEWVASDTMLTEGMEIYAQWNWSGYVVTFHANNGTDDWDAIGGYEPGDMLGEDLYYFQFQNPRHILDGWYTADGTRATESMRINGDVDLYAHWKECILYKEITGQVPAAASVYDGYLRDAGGNVKGTLQAKLGKTSGGKSKVKLSVQMSGGKKQSYKGTLDVATGELDVSGSRLKFGSNGLAGDFGGYTVEGARNIFASRTDGEAASAVLGAWLGPVNVKWSGGMLSAVVGKKGKVKVNGTVGGVKVSATSQLLVGEEMLCIPVIISKKANVAFELWLAKDTGSVCVIGVDDTIADKARKLAGGYTAEFHVDSDSLCELIGNSTYRYYLPDGTTVIQDGKKWVVAAGAKPGKLQLVKGATSPEDIDTAKAGGNPSALKLTYKAKDGSFKGSFKAYVVNKGKPKAVTVNVTGLLIGNVGYGEATIKKVGSVPITIR